MEAECWRAMYDMGFAAYLAGCIVPISFVPHVLLACCLTMEPLSIAAAIGGLLGVSSRLYEYLHAYFSTAKNAPRVLITLSTEIRDIQLALASLQVLLTSVASLPTQRTSLIQFEDLAITVTDTVLAYSELDATITPFITTQQQSISLKARHGWTRAEEDCLKIVDRLQRQKASLTLILSVLQW